jgi:hypothetical protein
MKHHPCKLIYEIGAQNRIYGNEQGVCRIIGEQSTGVNFEKWVADTFNDWSYLKPGTIISNEALFTFDEQSGLLQKKTGRDKLQRFRTYSHIIYNGEWYCLTKADKPAIFDMIISGAELVCLTETGQKHIFFKHRPGFWQLDDMFIVPDISILKQIHTAMCDLMRLGFSQEEIKTGQYKSGRIALAGLDKWRELEFSIQEFRGKPLFDFAGWMLFISEPDKEAINKMYQNKKAENAAKKVAKKEPKKEKQTCLNL